MNASLHKLEPPSKKPSVPVIRVQMVRDAAMSFEHEFISSSAQAAELFRVHLGDPDREHFVVLLLDTKNRPLAIETVAIGAEDRAVTAPTTVFRSAILAGATGIILGHNHPSGDPSPSSSDRVVTDKLLNAAQLLGVRLLDHVVLGADGRYESFSDKGWL